jgi:DNA-binding LacI/PurR family transcriptional regulator
MVAKKVGVSAMTVSKVINGKRDVKSERKEKVLRVIEKNI